MLIFFAGGVCLLAGVYGMFFNAHTPIILVLSVVWGSGLIGYSLGRD
jgi:hypothetical protein